MLNFNEYKNLNATLLKASDVYYNKDFTIMSDYDFDMQLKKLEKYEKENKDKILNNSISKKPGSKVKRNKVLIDVPMLSLKNSYNMKDFMIWFKNIIKKYNALFFNVTYKYDGMAVCLVYFKGSLVKAYTRGDGFYGTDITEHVRNIKLPKNVFLPGYTFVLGEVIITEKNFLYINRVLNANYKNRRNGVSGILNSKSVNSKLSSKLTFLPYDVINENINLGKTDKLKYLTTLGFDKPLLNLKVKDIKDIKHLYAATIKNKDDLEIPIDGLVIEVENRDSLKVKETKYKSLAIALKLPPETYTTKLKDIIWTKTKLGKLVPTGLLEPIVTKEFTIRKVYLYNVDFLIKNDIKLFDNVTIIRSGDSIPKIIKNKHTKNSKDIIIPK